MKRGLVGAAVVLVTLGVGACSPSEDTPDGVATDGASTPAVTQEWDPTQWTPTAEVSPPAFTDEEREQFRTEWLARSAEGLGEVPDVELVRWTDGWFDFGEARAECLQEAGFPAVHDGTGGTVFEPSVPEAQDAALALASFRCDAQYTIDPVYIQDWSEDQVGLLYDYWDQYFIPCMEAHGHTVSRTGQPSRAAFVAAFSTDERADWWPDQTLQLLPLEEKQVLSQKCPGYPPDDVFYGN